MNIVHRDRRAHPRRRALDANGIVRTRIRPGHAAALVDLSAAGALIETTRRLLPDTFVEMYVETRSHRVTVRGRIVRSAVISVRPAVVCYRAAIQFDSYLPWFVEDDGPVQVSGPAGRARVIAACEAV
jgi:hypothetical protein